MHDRPRSTLIMTAYFLIALILGMMAFLVFLGWLLGYYQSRERDTRPPEPEPPAPDDPVQW